MIPIMPAPPPPVPPTPQYRCQTCFVSFATSFQLEIHVDAYEVRALEQHQMYSLLAVANSVCLSVRPVQRLIAVLVDRLAKAAAHLIPIELDPPDADKYSNSNVSAKCPLPSCASVKPLKDMKFHFMQHVDCFEVCPGCGYTWTNVHSFLVHVKDCLKDADAAKKTHGQRRQRALVHRTVMRLQDAMDEFKTEPLDTRQDRPAPFLRQPQTPQTAFSGDPSLHPLLSRDASVKRHKRGTGPVYAASRETRRLDQAIGLTGPATTDTPQGQSWRPPGLPSHAFSREPSVMQDPMPSSAPLNSTLSPLSSPAKPPSPAKATRPVKAARSAKAAHSTKAARPVKAKSPVKATSPVKVTSPVKATSPVEDLCPVETPRLAEASPEAPSNIMSLDVEMDNVMQPVDWEMDDFIDEWPPGPPFGHNPN
ncbi:hypothetical protein TGAMA5MH_02724 [Trichoderma gamsii]|uniref:Uncharacterized protein n=1 Tax=Trichoderma gamsii TaxID=398673 RepID=A0A2K0TJ00_9HYPO|nr:hypothetical protein TGAMA5MH_02724 [Trichoderma gamsii]